MSIWIKLGVVTVLAGTWFWFIAGAITGMASFAQVGPQQSGSDVQSSSNMPFEVGAVWALYGAIASFILYLYFVTRPREEHNEPAGVIAPQSVSELKATFLALILGVLAAILLCKYYILRMKLPSTIALKPPKNIYGIATLMTVIASVVTIPLAGKIYQAFRRK